MAKGLEDTSFYRYNRLVSLNDVGGDPMRFGVTPEEFHREMQERTTIRPHSMVSGSTHDSKRSEDVRARINVLSEMPDEWAAQVLRWRESNQEFKRREASGEPSAREIPSPNDEYLFYQTLIGAWPLGPDAATSSDAFAQRMTDYMIKAVREAKDRTSWANQNQAYEQGVGSFVKSVIGSNEFRSQFLPFQRKVAYFGMLNSLSQILIRLTVPGVPDVYQGNELWEFNLVDPDNRRAVDYAARRHALHRIQAASRSARGSPAGFAQHLALHPDDGCVKLYVLWQALSVRNQRRELFQGGAYVPVPAIGGCGKHAFAFLRYFGNSLILVVLPRLCFLLSRGEMRLPVGEDIWGDCEIEIPEEFRVTLKNCFTGEVHFPPQAAGAYRLRVSSILRSFPIALLVGDRN